MTIIDTLRPGSMLAGDYDIIRVLGSGGFGNTYLAMDQNLNREVAVKEFFPRDIAFREDQTTVSIKNPRFEDNFKWGLERFVQEAKLLAKFRHPNIVRVFRTFEANHTSYIVLDFIRGPNVEEWLRRLNRRPTQQELDELVAPLTDALALLHESGVLHRDIKPANICIREETGDPVLLDFGASKYSMSEMTGTTAAIVSRGYSPYEAYATELQAAGRVDRHLWAWRNGVPRADECASAGGDRAPAERHPRAAALATAAGLAAGVSCSRGLGSERNTARTAQEHPRVAAPPACRERGGYPQLAGATSAGRRRLCRCGGLGRPR